MLQRAVLGVAVVVEDVERNRMVKACAKKGRGSDIEVKLLSYLLFNVI